MAGKDAADAAKQPAATRSRALHKRALRALAKGPERGDRATVALPYGCDEFAVGRGYAEQLDARLVVVCVPSVEAARQALIEFQARRTRRWSSAVLVGRDEATGVPITVADLALPARVADGLTATAGARAVQELLAAGECDRQLIVATYESAGLVGRMMQREGIGADLMVCAGAQWLQVRPRCEARALVSADALPSRRRLYLRVTDVERAAWEIAAAGAETNGAVLDDEQMFGPVVFAATRAAARGAHLVVDPEVAVVAGELGDDGLRYRFRSAEAVVAALGSGSTRVVSYQATDGLAARLAQGLDGRRLPDGRSLRAVSVEASATVAQRRRAAALLAEAGDAAVVVACTAGVRLDVAGADCVVLTAAQSPTDVVEAVGQASQAARGKARTRVVLPFLPEQSVDIDTALGKTSLRGVWMSLRALWAPDGQAARELLQVWRVSGPASWSTRMNEASARSGSFSAWKLRTVEPDGAEWWRARECLVEFMGKTGHARPSSGMVLNGLSLTSWSMRQRVLRAHRMLTQEQVASLDLPGFVWSQEEVGWWQAADRWTTMQREAGPWEDEKAFWSTLRATQAFDPVHPARRSYRNLAEFYTDTCRLRRIGGLAAHLERAAERLPGWRWDLVDEVDARMVDALVEYAGWKGDFNVPPGYEWDDDLRLGEWVAALPQRQESGEIGPGLAFALLWAEAQHPEAWALRWEVDGPGGVGDAARAETALLAEALAS